MPDVCPIGTEIQTLLFPKAKFATTDSARVWALKHGFVATKVDEKPATWRLRQHPPSRYERASFRTIPLGESGAQAVIGCPKQVAAARARRRARSNGADQGTNKILRERMRRLLGSTSSRSDRRK